MASLVATTVNGELTVGSPGKIIFSASSSIYLQSGTNSIALKNSGGTILWNSSTSITNPVDGHLDLYGASTLQGIGFNRDVSSGAIYNSSVFAYQIHSNQSQFQIQRYNGSGTFLGYGLVINTGGNVGMGTDTPYRNAHIYQAADNDQYEGALQVGGNSASVGGYFGYNSTSSGRLTISSLNNSGGANAKIFLGFGLDGDGSPATEVMTLNQGGYVGIGINAPDAKLHVQGDDPQIRIGDNAGTNKFIDIRSNNGNAEFVSRDNAAHGNFKFITEASTTELTRMTIRADGNVGIGTETPAQILHVQAATSIVHVQSSTSNANASIWFNSNVSGTQANRWEIGTNISRGASLEIFDRLNSASRLELTNTGLLGIGQAPTANFGTLQVYATGNHTNEQNAAFTIGDNATGGMRIYGGVNNSSNYAFIGSVESGTAYRTLILQPNGANVGIGTVSAAQKFSVFQGRIGVTDGYQIGNLDGNTGMLTYSGSRITFEVGGGEKMRVNSSGSVGIGETNPDKPLHIKGTNTAGIVIENTTNATNMDIDWYNNVGSVAGRIRYSEGSGDFSFMPNQSTNAVVFKYDGKVGIGTGTPFGTLHCNDATIGGQLFLTRTSGGASSTLGRITFGNTNIDSNLASIGAIQDGASDSGKLEFLTQPTGGATLARITIKGDGNVGIGTATPGKRLEVIAAGNYDGIEIGSSSGHVRVIDFTRTPNSANPTARIQVMEPGSTHTSDMRFYTSDASGGAPSLQEQMIINPNGRVGIGTNSPETKLHVEGSSYTESSIKMERSGSGADEDAGLIFSKSSTASDGHRIGGIYFGHTGTNYCLIRGEMIGSTGGRLYIVTASQTNPMSNSAIETVSIEEGVIQFTGDVRPRVDSTYTLGTSSLRWSHLYVDAITCGGAISGTGASITTLSATNLSSGTVNVNRLGSSGTRNSSTFLRGDNTWATVSGGGGDTVSITTSAADILSVSSGAISAVDAGSGDRIVFWDNGSNKLAYLDNGDGLSFSGTNLVVTDRVKRIYKGSTSSGTYVSPDSSGYLSFYEGTGIALSFSGSSITFSSSTGSDYRLKKNISTFNSEAWTKVKGVNLRKFDFDEDAFKAAVASPDREITEEPKNYKDNVGFIAHELAEVGIQGSVIGDKDAVDEDGNFIYQKVNYIALVPVLWGALKEAISKIETLESKVQALEDK